MRSARPGAFAAHFEQSETYYYDIYQDGYLSDDERDEDADGLTNYDETHGRMEQEYWAACYRSEKPWHIAFAAPAMSTRTPTATACATARTTRTTTTSRTSWR